MPVVVHDKFVFLHVPRTGGTWVTEVLSQCVKDYVVIDNSGHTALKEAKELYPDKMFLGFIRNPLTWYQSYFLRRIEKGWTSCPFDASCEAPIFSDFIKKVIDYEPAYLTTMYKGYFGEGLDEITIGDYGELPWHLMVFLTQRRIKYDKDKVFSIPRQNRSEYKIDVTYPDNLRDDIVYIEREIFNRFVFQEEPTSISKRGKKCHTNTKMHFSVLRTR